VRNSNSTCNPEYSNTVTITINQQLLPGAIADNQTICHNTTPDPLTSATAASGGTGTFAYQWQSSTNSGATWTNISGATSTAYTPGALTQTTQYRRQVRNSDDTCNPEYSNTVTITVNQQLLPGTIADDETICYNDLPDALLSITAASGGTGTYAYQWQSSTNSGATWTNIPGATSATHTPGTLTQTTQYRREVRNANNTCEPVHSNTVTKTVSGSELIPGTIAENQTICHSATPNALTSTADASGGIGNYLYLWQSSTNDGTTWSNISGATSATYTPGALTQTTQYRREARNSDGTCKPDYSNVVIITVNPQLLAGTIADDQTICYSTTPNALTSTADASGGTGTYTYQWQFNDEGTWTNISGATSTTHTPGTLTQTMQYRREARNSNGTCEPVYSNTVTITVNPELLPGEIADDQTICHNATPAPLTSVGPASGGTGTYTYQWQSNNGSTWTNISGATSATYTPEALTQTTQYRRQVRNSNETCDPVYSNTVTITVNPELLPGTIAEGQTICHGATPDPLTSITAASGGTGDYTYQWQSSTNNGTTWTDIPGETSTTYTPDALTQTTQYRRQARNSDNTCSPVYSNTITITVNPQLQPGTIAADETICYNETPNPLTSITAASGGTGTYAYQWQYNNDGTWANISGSTSATYTPGALTQTTQYRRMVSNSNGTCTSVYSNTVTITVSGEELIPGTIATDQTICHSATPDPLTSTADASGGIESYLYQWQSSVNGGTTWSNIGGATSVGYAPGTLTQTTQYRREVRNSDGTCKAGHSNTITITVNPQLEAGAIADDQTICYSATPNPLTSTTAASGGTGNYAYQWQVNDEGTWTNISGATSATYTLGALTQTMQYRREARNSNGTCAPVYSNTVTITVNPQLEAGTIAGDRTICYDTAPGALTSTAAATGGTGTYAYQWQSSTNSSSTWTDIPGATSATYTPGALEQTTQYRRQVRNSNGTCNPVYSNVVTITVNPQLLAGTITATQAICYNQTPNTFTSTPASGGTGTYAYQWQLSTNSETTWSNISGETSADYAPGALTQTTQYRRQARNSDDSCSPVYSNTITVTVHPEASITLSSASSTIDQAICETQSIANITYTLSGGATEANVTGLPTGVTGSYNESTRILTISGTPTATGTFNYTVTTTGHVAPCTPATAYGKIIISRLPTITIIETDPVCGGETTELSITTVSENADVTVAWHDDKNTIIGDNTGTTVTVKPPHIKSGTSYQSTYSYKVTVHDGCQATFDIPVRVHEPLIGNLTPTLWEICEGIATTIDARSYGADTHYSWTSTPPALEDIKPEARITVSPTQTTTYMLKISRGVCTETDQITIVVNDRPVILDIKEIGIRDREIIYEYGKGSPPFKFGVDNRPADDDPVKYNLSFSRHTFYIIDNAGCHSADTSLLVKIPKLFFPPHFSPNGDGINDTWEIPDMDKIFPNAVITIYDRFGKQLARYRGSDKGWDGTYLGRDMPTTDYWFVIDIEEINQQFTGHFTLLRK
jgi:gliding motility-associated-like protein